MIAGVFQYSFAQAKTRAMKGNLLDAEDWHYLTRMRSIDELLRYLGGTAYAGALAGPSGLGHDVRAVIHGLYEDLFHDYERLMKAVPTRAAKLLKSLLGRYEAENLKTILRGIWKAEAPSMTRSLLYHLDRLSEIPVDDLLQAREVAAAADLLEGTIFLAPFIYGLPQIKAQGRLFPIEIAIDMAVFRHITETLQSVRTFPRSEAQRLTGELIDWVNLGWIVRFRHFFGFSPEETINYTLPGGSRLGLRDLGNLARALDVPSFIAALPQPYKEAAGEAERWQSIPVLIQRWFIRQLYRAFQKNPFQIGLQVSYLLLKEMEVKCLESLMCALEIGQSPEKVSGLIGLPVRGGAHV